MWGRSDGDVSASSIAKSVEDFVRTLRTVAEKGTPLSLAKAQVCLLAVATQAMTLPVIGRMMSMVIAIVAPTLPVAL